MTPRQHRSDGFRDATSGVWSVGEAGAAEDALFALHDAKNLALALGADMEWLEQACARGGHDELVPVVAEMARTCRALSDLLRGALRRQTPRHVPEPVAALLEAARQRQALRAERLRVRLRVDARPDLVGDIDAPRLGRVLDNLLDNALRVAPPGSEVVLFSDRDGDDLIVGVSDQGPGIDAEAQRHIFDLFFGDRGPYSTGVGLAFCRQVAVEHGGHLAVDSAPGRGATFVLRFPARREPR